MVGHWLSLFGLLDQFGGSISAEHGIGPPS
jgi:hypothetical protein